RAPGSGSPAQTRPSVHPPPGSSAPPSSSPYSAPPPAPARSPLLPIRSPTPARPPFDPPCTGSLPPALPTCPTRSAAVSPPPPGAPRPPPAGGPAPFQPNVHRLPGTGDAAASISPRTPTDPKPTLRARTWNQQLTSRPATQQKSPPFVNAGTAWPYAGSIS